MTTRSGRMLGLSLCCLSAAGVVSAMLYLGFERALLVSMAVIFLGGIAYALAETREMRW